MAKPQFVDRLIVRSLSGNSTHGRLTFASQEVQCSLGRTGISRNKREGDGASPAGAYPLRCALYRADRVVRPRTGLPLHPLRPGHGWCDDPKSACYNRLIHEPFVGSAEDLWRTDDIYNVIVVLGHNYWPIIRDRGSAIFLHVATAEFGATGGCVGLRQDDLLRVLSGVGPHTELIIV